MQINKELIGQFWIHLFGQDTVDRNAIDFILHNRDAKALRKIGEPFTAGPVRLLDHKTPLVFCLWDQASRKEIGRTRLFNRLLNLGTRSNRNRQGRRRHPLGSGPNPAPQTDEQAHQDAEPNTHRLLPKRAGSPLMPPIISRTQDRLKAQDEKAARAQDSGSQTRPKSGGQGPRRLALKSAAVHKPIGIAQLQPASLLRPIPRNRTGSTKSRMSGAKSLSYLPTRSMRRAVSSRTFRTRTSSEASSFLPTGAMPRILEEELVLDTPDVADVLVALRNPQEPESRHQSTWQKRAQ